MNSLVDLVDSSDGVSSADSEEMSEYSQGDSGEEVTSVTSSSSVPGGDNSSMAEDDGGSQEEEVSTGDSESDKKEENKEENKGSQQPEKPNKDTDKNKPNKPDNNKPEQGGSEQNKPEQGTVEQEKPEQKPPQVEIQPEKPWYDTDIQDITTTAKVTMQDIRSCKTVSEDIRAFEFEKSVIDGFRKGDPCITFYTSDENEFQQFKNYWITKYHYPPTVIRSGEIQLQFCDGPSSLQYMIKVHDGERDCEEEIEKIVKSLGITAGMSQREALGRMVNYICNNVSYDVTQNKNTLKSAVDEHIGTCISYSKLLEQLANYCGIGAQVVAGTVGRDFHMWVAIKIPNESNGYDVLHIDPTFADEKTRYEEARNEYFLQESFGNISPYYKNALDNYDPYNLARNPVAEEDMEQGR